MEGRLTHLLAAAGAPVEDGRDEDEAPVEVGPVDPMLDWDTLAAVELAAAAAEDEAAARRLETIV